MAKRTSSYGTVRSLYGELEAARREWENATDEVRRSSFGQQPAGVQAYGLWLELLDLAEWHMEATGDDEGDDIDTAMGGDSSDVDGSDELEPQLELPEPGGPAPSSGNARSQAGGMERPLEDVPRGTFSNEIRGRAMARALGRPAAGAGLELKRSPSNG